MLKIPFFQYNVFPELVFPKLCRITPSIKEKKFMQKNNKIGISCTNIFLLLPWKQKRGYFWKLGFLQWNCVKLQRIDLHKFKRIKLVTIFQNGWCCQGNGVTSAIACNSSSSSPQRVRWAIVCARYVLEEMFLRERYF